MVHAQSQYFDISITDVFLKKEFLAMPSERHLIPPVSSTWALFRPKIVGVWLKTSVIALSSCRSERILSSDKVTSGFQPSVTMWCWTSSAGHTLWDFTKAENPWTKNAMFQYPKASSKQSSVSKSPWATNSNEILELLNTEGDLHARMESQEGA